MTIYSLSHLSDGTLLQNFATHLATHRTSTATLIAYLAEADVRKLYRPAGYPSMFAYCVGEFGMSEDEAYKRIGAARVAREFPAIFPALADGRLNLTGVVRLKPHLTSENADELLDGAAGKSKSEIEAWLAGRFPGSEMLPMVQALPAAAPPASTQLVPEPVEPSAPGRSEAAGPRSKVAPIAAQRFALQLTMSQSTHDKLRHAQALLSHQIPDGDIAQVLDRVLDLAIAQLEKRKFAATDRPRPTQKRSTNRRTIPAHVRRAVRERDGEQCTFVSASGHRCAATSRLEFDHIVAVARGGESTVGNLRLLCRAHNQYAAEHTFGAAVMSRKRQEASRARQEAQAAAETRAASEARAAADAQAKQRAKEKAQEVIPWLRRLGIRAADARRAAERCESIPEASLEERVKVALSCFGPRTPSRGGVASVSAGCGP